MHREGPNSTPPPTADEPRARFEADGYFIHRALIPAPLIDALLAAYRRRILPSRKPFFRQSIDAWARNRLSPDGYAIDSFLDIHDLADPDVQEACAAARDIFCHHAVRGALAGLTGHANHSLMQSMLFDLNTATAAHQDDWYLDTVPNGNLLAGWFALEDIDERAGRFFVLPGSNRVRFDLDPDELTSNRAFARRVSAYVDAHRDEVVAPALKKGDVLFWGSRTIHGSLPTQDPRFSRKSLTAHYMPSQFDFGSSRGQRKDVLYRMHGGMPYRASQRRDTLATRAVVGAYHYLSNRHPRLYRALDAVRVEAGRLRGRPFTVE